MKSEKTISLKKLQEELLDLVKNKYYGKDKEIANCIDRINAKYEENATKAFERKLMRIEKGEQAKPISVELSLDTLQLCDKLIVKEKISNQIMGYEAPFDLIKAEQEIKGRIAKWIK